MRRTMLHSKIHRATVTGADLDYEGSVSIDTDLLEAADIVSGQQVHIWNITRGSRIVTYALPGESGSGTICINGAAAHQNSPGDVVIIASWVELEESKVQHHQPRVVRVDSSNRITGTEQEIPGPSQPYDSRVPSFE
ncbi:MAG: aspartate 1-decarboxylase [Planctomycetes bacterium]|jgi:aspartate 1-decarboxylase|nr:aspartate 1-decarboxylase [Planctomycetota bacterium]MBT6453442.1 aspartate 1-decarboxylase [Planctomycetota bacterium]MBT6540607.1 aspartate 1-decarboxylase [Planctomycetota bacterium]MBT6968150.1 aspartate 1-decarboxylase [Planctomycetota bacterium]MBT7102939.1 aspartate 1-decarboxylase [Planctomycetota bacterium]